MKANTYMSKESRMALGSMAAQRKLPKRTLTVYAIDGTVIATATAKSNAQRSSVRGAADQKQLDAMHTTGVAFGSIAWEGEGKSTMVWFTFDAQKLSQHTYKAPEFAT